MKKTIFNASFEESQNYVTEKYIITSLEESAKKIVAKRVLGVILTDLILIAATFLVRYVENEAPVINHLLASYIAPVIYIVTLIIPLYYLCKLFDFRNRQILSSYFFNYTMGMLVFSLSILGYLFFVNLASAITNMNILIYIYLLIFFGFILNRWLSLNSKIWAILYKKGTSKNKILDRYNKFEGFAKKYGFLVIIILFIFRRFFNSDPNSSSDYTLIQKISVGLSPLIGLIVIAFIFAMIESFMEGYYVKKYCEEYRIKYGYSKKDWYGSKSKAYKEELKKSNV